MAYTISNPNQIVYLTKAWADPGVLIDLCTSSLANQFQTQNARTTVQQQFGDVWKSLPSLNVRFPATGYYVFRYDPVLDPLITALLNSFDTRNRIIETENPVAPTSSEVANATQRVDDATVAIRACINNLMNELSKGTGMLNQSLFETNSQLTWTTAAAVRT